MNYQNTALVWYDDATIPILIKLCASRLSLLRYLRLLFRAAILPAALCYLRGLTTFEAIGAIELVCPMYTWSIQYMLPHLSTLSIRSVKRPGSLLQ
jgi:hypothetical protein